MRNSYDLLPIENNIENLEEDEEVTFTADARKRKTRSNRMNKGSIKNDNRYDHNNHISVSQKVVPGNRTYASATKYGKKAIVIGDSHLKRINRKLFNDSLPNCKGQIKYFSGANAFDLEHYIKPTLMKNKPDAVIIHI